MSGRRRTLVVPSESGSDSEPDFEVLDVSLPASAGGSRAGSVARRRRLPDRAQVIEILDSDEEDGPRGRHPNNHEFQQEMDGEFGPSARLTEALEAALERQARGERERLRDLAQLREMQRGGPADVRSPPPPPAPAPPRTFGGAVFRRGDEQVRFRPDRPAQHMRVNRDEERPWRVTAPQMDPNHPDHVLDDPDLPPLRARVGLAHRIEENRGLQHFLRTNIGRMMDAFGWNGGVLPEMRGGLGERAPPLDPKAIVDMVKPDEVPNARAGFTYTWDADDLGKEVEEKEKRAQVIQVDEHGGVVPEPKAKRKGKVYLACAACPEPLRVSGATRTPDDRVWALRCGHVLDERCFKAHAQPADGAEQPPLKRPRKTRASAKNREHLWKCPVCEREHVSVLVEGTWEPKPGFGGVQVYV